MASGSVLLPLNMLYSAEGKSILRCRYDLIHSAVCMFTYISEDDEAVRGVDPAVEQLERRNQQLEYELLLTI